MKHPDRRLTPQRAPRSPAAQTRAGHVLAMGFRSAYLTFHRRANAVFAHFKLTSDQFVLLAVLAEANGVKQKELMRRTNSDPNTISEMLGRLERRGLVARQRHIADGRAWSVSLTETGRETQRRAMEGAAPLNIALANLVGADEMEKLLDYFERIVDSMSTAEIPRNGARTPAMPVRRNGTRAGRGRQRTQISDAD